MLKLRGSSIGLWIRTVYIREEEEEGIPQFLLKSLHAGPQ
jgi:hypothetical protein